MCQVREGVLYQVSVSPTHGSGSRGPVDESRHAGARVEPLLARHLPDHSTFSVSARSDLCFQRSIDVATCRTAASSRAVSPSRTIADGQANRQRGLAWVRFEKMLGKRGRHPNSSHDSRDSIAVGMSLADGHWTSGTGIRLARMTIWSSAFFRIVSSTVGRNCPNSRSFLSSKTVWSIFHRQNPHPSTPGNSGGLTWPLVAGGSI